MSRSRSPRDTDRTCVDVDASSEHEAPAKQPRVGEPEVDNHGFDMVTQGPRHSPAPATPPRRLECSGSGKDESYESIGYNDACRNIKRLIVKDREACTRQFPEGRVTRWFFDDYQDQNGKWHSGLAPPRSHWWLDAANPVEPELDEKAMRLLERLIVGDGGHGAPPELTPYSTEYILCGRNGIKDKARSYRYGKHMMMTYKMIDKEIIRARKMARAELEHMNGPSENQPRGVKRMRST